MKLHGSCDNMYHVLAVKKIGITVCRFPAKVPDVGLRPWIEGRWFIFGLPNYGGFGAE